MKTAVLLTTALLTAATLQAAPNTMRLISQQEVAEAALAGNKTVIDTALKQQFAVDTADADKRTALMFAAFNAQTDIVQMLIEAGADVNRQDIGGTSPLMFAASAPNGTAALSLLLDAGADINMVDRSEHFTALMWAAAEGQAGNVKLLLARGADPALQDIDGDTAASFAAKAGHTAVVQILKEAGKQPEKP